MLRNRSTSVSMMLWLASCASAADSHGDAPVKNTGGSASAAQMGAATCEALGAEALHLLMSASSSVPQCSVDADCKAVDVPADCLSSCNTVLGGDGVRSALASKAAELASVCDRFHQEGCTVSEGGCPVRPNSYSCVMSKCVSASPPDTSSCYDLGSRAVDILLAASTSVAQCAVDSDCKAIAVPAACVSSCITVVGNDDVKSAIAAKADMLEDVCNRFRQKGCTVSEGGCTVHSNVYACHESKCVSK